VLVDFGTVCDGWRAPDEPGSTVVGTYGYMPPEQYMGQVSARSDLYALGATLMHVITGRMPHRFPFDSGRIEVPDTLPASPRLIRLVRALLEPAPRDRPASVAEARRILLDPPSADREPAPVGTRTRQGPWIAAAAVIGFALMVTMFAAVRRRWTYVAIAWGLAALVGLVWWARPRAGRGDANEDLSARGAYTFGRVVSASRVSGRTWEVGYEFVHDGRTYRGRARVPDSLGRRVTVGDRTGVLYDADDPARCLLAYRPPPRPPAG
jgi:hypothetical protein